MIRGDIRTLHAYAVADCDGLIKLDAMENPYAMPADLRKALASRLAEVDINRYPDATHEVLREKIAVREGCRADQVILGNGSDEIIQMLLLATDHGPCVVPRPSFVMYSLIARWLRRPLATMPLDADFQLDADAFLRICSREKAAIAFLSCPNNPTGNLWPRHAIESIVENFPGLIVIDEAYAAFSGHTHVDLIAPNVVILRTFSKMGWAGLRLGYALGDTALIHHLNKVRLPYNLDSLTQTAADVLLDSFDIFESQAQKIRAERKRLFRALAGIDGVRPYPSQANFILMRVANADLVFNALLRRGILVKNLHEQDDLLRGCLRVTIGTPIENNRFLKAIKEILA